MYSEDEEVWEIFIRTKAGDTIINGIRAGLSDQEIVQLLQEDGFSGYSEEDVAQVRRTRHK